jgi:hypothetical protein
MIKVSLSKGFTLPRLGKEAFAKLMRSGVEYDKASGLFIIKDASKIDSIVAIIRESTNDTISIELQCVLCGKDAGCYECEFSNGLSGTISASLLSILLGSSVGSMLGGSSMLF